MKLWSSLCALPLLALLPAVSLGAAGCATEVEAGDEGEEDLTSLTARSRQLSFDGVVYVAPNSSDATIQAAVDAQTRTAFGAFREADIAVNSRELKAVNPATFKKRPVTVIDTSVEGDAGKPMLEVRYRYVDDAIVGLSYANQTTTTSALLGQRNAEQRERVLRECTANDRDARDYPIWYTFNPNTSACQTAMNAEDRTIREAQAKLGAAAGDKISKAQVDRLYLPITVKLGADRTRKGMTYPEYDRLYAGGVEPNKLVMGLVYGMIDHDPPSGGPQDDSGYSEWADNLKELMAARNFEFVSIDAPEGLNARLSTGRTLSSLTFKDILGWADGGTAGMTGLTSAERQELKKLMGQRFFKHWITLEAKARVKIGSAAEKDFTYKVITYFGVESDQAPHKFAIKNSDVYVYNGHSYVGSGPLDPTRFRETDFPKSYQILFIDGCVSYNYYHKGYIPLKEGGTRNLDLITNGLETPAWRSGYAAGRLLATLINGQSASYQQLLEEAEATDRMRVVDGEVDNKYRKSRTPITVR
jgi:hypothetical protein